MVYKVKNNSIKFFDDYSSTVSDKKHGATKGTGLKILTPKQMFQRLPIAKTGNQYELTQYNSLNVKLSNSQLGKLKSAMKNETELVLRLSSDLID